MDYLSAYAPRGGVQCGLTAIGATVAALVVLRSLLRRRKKLAGKVVVITGASSGIGEALAHEFVKNGCKVILAARSVDKLKRLKEELLECYKVDEESVAEFFVDLEDHASLPQACRSLLSIHGHVDILINNAGIGCRAKVTDTELDTYKKVMDINYFGQIAVTKGLLPQMIERGGGTIVAVSSLQGRFALPGGSAYGSSKHALQAFCDSLRAENDRHNIDVLVVSPSYVKTNIAQATVQGTGVAMGELSPRSLSVAGRRVEIDNGMSSESCARGILDAIKNCKTDFLIGPFHHKLVVYIRALCPSLYHRFMSRL